MANKTNRLTERQFQTQIIEWARSLGWRVHAERPARFRDGTWATHVQGDIGWPDLAMARGSRLIIAELKVGRNKVVSHSPQDRWLHALLKTGVEVYTWRPEAWSQILVVLSKP